MIRNNDQNINHESYKLSMQLKRSIQTTIQGWFCRIYSQQHFFFFTIATEFFQSKKDIKWMCHFTFSSLLSGGVMNVSSYVACICASGPSLDKVDILSFYDHGADIYTTNNSWQLCYNKHNVVAADETWWDINYHLVPGEMTKWTYSEYSECKHSLRRIKTKFHHTYNSGMVAIAAAIESGAKAIFLLGFDCDISEGVHWHGRHKGMHNPNQTTIKRWLNDFLILSKTIPPDVLIINCSRKTKLTAFKKMSVEKGIELCKQVLNKNEQMVYLNIDL